MKKQPFQGKTKAARVAKSQFARDLLEKAERAGILPDADKSAARPYTVKLSLEASNVVRWYCGITHHSPAYTVDGIVTGNLRAAREAYEEDGDDSFNIALQHVLDAVNSDDRAQLLGRGEGVHVELHHEAAAWLAKFAELRGGKEAARAVVSVAVVETLSRLWGGRLDGSLRDGLCSPHFAELDAAMKRVQDQGP